MNAQTLRYYERRGLLPEPARSAAGYREYTPEAVRVVRFVKRAQLLGFALEEIEELLNLADGGPEHCDAVRVMAGEHMAGLDRRIAALTAMREALARLVDTCEMPRQERDCPILHELDPGAVPGASTP